MCSRRRIASVIPLRESPLTPYMRCTPAANKTSTSRSATLFAMCMPFSSLLRVHPRVRSHELDGHIRQEKAQRLAIRGAPVIGGDQERPSLLIAFPRCDQDTGPFL